MKSGDFLSVSWSAHEMTVVCQEGLEPHDCIDVKSWLHAGRLILMKAAPSTLKCHCFDSLINVFLTESLTTIVFTLIHRRLDLQLLFDFY